MMNVNYETPYPIKTGSNHESSASHHFKSKFNPKSKMNEICNNRIEHLQRTTWPCSAVAMAPTRSKGGHRKWKDRQLADMNDSTYLAKLEKAGNIGVALGKVSGGLVTIDLDDDKYVDAFLEANPSLTHSLRTRGSRGCNIWLRCSG